MTDAIKNFFSSPSAIATILVAVIGQALLSTVWQIRNNEQQASQITQNFRQTEDLRKTGQELQIRVSQIDAQGTRALDTVVNNQTRMLTQLERLSDRETATEQRISDLQAQTLAKIDTQIKLLDDRQSRIISILEGMAKGEPARQ